MLVPTLNLTIGKQTNVSDPGAGCEPGVGLGSDGARVPRGQPPVLMPLPFVSVVAAVLGFFSLMHVPVGATTVFVAPKCSFPPRSPCGDDNNDGGSADTPLASLTKARDTLRAAGDGDPKEVVLADGVYELSEVLELTAEDSGTVWAAAGGSTGNVTLSGGEAMYPGWLKQVMSADVLSQLPTDDARKHVRKVESPLPPAALRPSSSLTLSDSLCLRLSCGSTF